MLDFLRAAARSFEAKIGWSKVGVVLSLTIIAVACYVLYHKLHDIDPARLWEALATIPRRDIALAALFVVAGYFTLTFYDLFAVRTVGRKDVPYRICALAGFTSYSVGHNVGASALTGGAVRYRIYSSWDISAVDVARICFIAGLTFWLGNVAILGIGFIIHPEAAAAINHLPDWFNRSLGILALIVLTGYVAWVWQAPRVIGRDNWVVRLPGGPLTLLQINIGIVDLTCCALAMYMLVPQTPEIDFITVAVIFISATLLGFASHSPGGLGVFDAAMLLALWQYDREELLAGLLVFRILYYLTPFFLSLIILGARELILSLRKQRDVGAG